MNNDFIQPNWPAPAHIKAYTSCRSGGVSLAPFDQFNLGDHVGDSENHVATNRMLLQQKLALPATPLWLQQTHSTIVLEAQSNWQTPTGDAIYTQQANQVCVIMTADCLPILLCNRQGTHIAALHAGWRGLVNGIIENTINQIALPASEWLAWLGPAIGPTQFEVGAEVREAFMLADLAAQAAFVPSPTGRWYADLYALARLRLNKLGVDKIFGGEYCTYLNEEKFFSYRRDNGKTGRMATVIWLADQ